MSIFNFSGNVSPPKRNGSVPLPFCTSPSQLQEITLDQDVTFPNTVRSPSGAMRGRSVKEFEEKMSNLGKENFNLKLRIYFLEEKMKTNFTLDKDNIVKQNIEFKIEIANLQRELQEKHDLLCQAVKAMELEEQEHKKVIQNNEEQLTQYRQELEDLRIQLQLSAEKENNASLQIILDQKEVLQSKYEVLQKDCLDKDDTIRSLKDSLNESNDKVLKSREQIREFETKLDRATQEYAEMSRKMQQESKAMDDLMDQVSDLRKNYTIVKSELEREHKKSERLKTYTDSRITELEEENDKLKLKVRDQQDKLEAAMLEVKKNQNLAVSKSLAQKSIDSNTDADSFSVSNPATPTGTAKAHSLHVSLTDKIDVSHLERLVLGSGAGEDAHALQILSDVKSLKTEHQNQKQKIVQLKAEQIKACQIIKSMIETRNKASHEIEELKKKISGLEHELESVVTKPDRENMPLRDRLSELNITAAVDTKEKENTMAAVQTDERELTEHYRALTVELENKIEILVATLQEKDSQMVKFRAQYETILKNLDEKENRIVDLEFELLSANPDLSNKVRRSLFEKSDMGNEKSEEFYKEQIEEKDKEIERLNFELKKCTCYLQELVNKELWDKNKEIEKLHIKQGQSEIIKLKKELLSREQQLKVLKEKISELGLDISLPLDSSLKLEDDIDNFKNIKQKLISCMEEKKYFEQQVEDLQKKLCEPNGEEALQKLQKENELLLRDAQKAEQLRLEANEVSSVLSIRLEELAIFLDSLLRQKSVLGFLGIHKNQKIKEIIDNSLDLSRSFTMSMIQNPDQSLAQLTNITALLNGSNLHDLSLKDLGEEESNSVLSIMPANATLTYQSHLYNKQYNRDSESNHEQVIAALRHQIFNLQHELQLRDVELNKLNNITCREMNDKSTETDYEFCTNIVSKALGTNKCNNTTSTTLKYQSDNVSESESWSEPDRVVSRARIGLNCSLPIIGRYAKSKQSSNDSNTEEELRHVSPSKRHAWVFNKDNIVDLQKQICDLEDQLSRKTLDLNCAEQKLNEETENSKTQLEILESKLNETEIKLAQSEAKKNEAEAKIKALQNVVDDLLALKKSLEEGLEGKDKELQNKINQLEVEKEQTLKLVKDLQQQVNDANNEMQASEAKLKQMQNDFDQLESTLRKEYEGFTIEKLKGAEEVFLKQIKSIEIKAKNEIMESQQKIKLMEDEVEQNYVKKCEVQGKIVELEACVNELELMRQVKISNERMIEDLRIKEMEGREKLQDCNEKINSLRRDLDNTTLQYSEAVLERTKLMNEKTKLEQEFNKMFTKESEMKEQISDIQNELNKVQNTYKQQISSLQSQKSKLDLKVSELESINADLHNRLIKLQTARGSELSSSLPSRFYDNGSKTLPAVLYKRQCSDNQYSSEENYEERVFPFGRAGGNNVPHQGDAERLEANSSPDLGIESDHGRFSSLETQQTVNRPFLQTIELTESMSNLLDAANQVDSVGCGNDHCCQKSVEIAHENSDLKRKLLKMRRALEETLNQLNLANQRKKQVEKTICRQIHKTSQVLRKAKANLDSGSETDMYKT